VRAMLKIRLGTVTDFSALIAGIRLVRRNGFA
jgi:hypothetical protein